MKGITVHILRVTVLLILLPILLTAQNFGQLYIEEIASSNDIHYIVRDPSKAVLIVHSPVPDLSFESNGVIFEIERPYTGIYRLWLQPGTHILTFKTGDHLPRKKRFYFPQKAYIEVQVSSDLSLELTDTKTSEDRSSIYGALNVNTTPQSTNLNLTSLGWYKGMALSENTPYKTKQLFPGEYLLALEREGYQTWIDTIQIMSNKRTNLSVWLRKEIDPIRNELQSIEKLIYNEDSKAVSLPILLSLLGSGSAGMGLIIGFPYLTYAGILGAVSGIVLDYNKWKNDMSQHTNKYGTRNIQQIKSRLHNRIFYNQDYNDSLPPPTFEITDLE